ncbi:hypothetical protein MRB53_012789 [Persea americana]|uniref:Uncharacterized protein n=1 Tax=Persea americana TaxID=3435 RepID=A0ACC2M004_PERAE|nr:hypothetical protein MRB53_012789 [Persea americana]
MQDPNTFQSMKPQFAPEQEHLKCPRCDSTNTKFCYYNNYNLSQPRHFCKNCRRYWTKGGALRNIPVGGGSRKNKQRSNPKRSSSSSSAPQSVPKTEPSMIMYPPPTVMDQDRRMLDISGSFSALLNSNGQFGNLLDSMNSTSSSVQSVQFGDFQENPIQGTNSNLMVNQGLDLQNTNNPETFLGLQGDWSSGNGWPDLAIYTPGSNFQ